MTDIAATAIRIASSGAMTARGVILRMPYPRQEAAETVQRMIASGELVLREDGTVRLTQDRQRKPYTRIARSRVLDALSKRPHSRGELAELFGCTKHAAQQHLSRLLADGVIRIIGYDKRPNVRGYAGRIYDLARRDDDA